MRVLIAAGFLGHFGETDGVVTTYRHLLPYFARAGTEVDVLVYGPEDRVDVYGSVRLFVHRPRVPLRVDPRRWIDLAVGGSRLARERAATRYDVVQSSTPDPLGRWARAVARRQGCAFIALYHTALAEYAAIRAGRVAGAAVGRLLGRTMDLLLDRYYDSADLVLAPSESVRADLALRLRTRVDVLGRGVDCRVFHPGLRASTGSRVRALYVGRVAPEKNLDLLARLSAARTDVDLTIVGDGPACEELKRRLPRATFTGRLAGTALSRAYADADFFVFPSRTDTLGNVVLEAMASGLPVVVTDRMGPKELVAHGVTGFVAPTDDAFASAVDTLVADGDRRRRMGQAARAFAATRSWEAIFEQLGDHYRRVLGHAPRPRTAYEVLHVSAH
jgi:phosphatidylinositol alpha 1,6-mannosyltransferase